MGPQSLRQQRMEGQYVQHRGPDLHPLASTLTFRGSASVDPRTASSHDLQNCRSGSLLSRAVRPPLVLEHVATRAPPMPDAREVATRVRQAQRVVRAALHGLGGMIVLAAVLPDADRADLVVPSFIEREEATTSAQRPRD